MRLHLGRAGGASILAGLLLGAALALNGSAAFAARTGQPSSAPSAYTIAFQLVTSDITAPVHITHAGDGSGRLFVVEKGGYVRVVKNGALLAAPYLDIHTLVSTGSEQGLLSIAFDPDYQHNGLFYLNYTNTAGDTIIARYEVANPAADVAGVIAVTPVITIDQPQSNHNGGQLQFGVNDDYLYIGMGDGGSGGDPHGPIGNGQNPGVLLGKMLRVNVRGVPTYTIPASNPFTQTAGYAPEIWAMGLRNPWRFSFDRATGDLYIGDVGQNCWEEIDYQPAGSSGQNYGWRVMEGLRPFNPQNFFDCTQPPVTPPTMTAPIAVYGRDLGGAVTGGYVYRGAHYPWLSGVYFYADFGTGRVWALTRSGQQWTTEQVRGPGFAISSFGEDESGELYVASYYGNAVYRLTATAPSDFSASSKQAAQTAVDQGDRVTYTIVLHNAGSPTLNMLRVTDTLPIGLSYVPGSFSATHGSVSAGDAPLLTWQGVVSNATRITLTYAAQVDTAQRQVLFNHAQISDGFSPPFTRSAVITVNGLLNFLPLVQRN